MNVEKANVEIRKRGLLEVTDLAFRYVVGLGGMLYLKLFLVFALPLVLLLWAAQRFLELSWFWTWCWALLLGSGVQGIFTVAAGRLMFERDVRFGAVTRQFFSRLGSYLGGLFLSRFLMALSAMVVIALPIVWVRMAHVHEASLLEGATAGAAIKRSSRFSENYTGATFAMLLVLGASTLTFVIGAEVIGQALLEDVFQLGLPFGDLFEDGGSLFALLGFFASLVFCATTRFLSYIDARTRRDGWDIQVRFMAIRARAEEAL
ncbi:MAG: hypothetical protein KC766_15775 [Myxococcales bacterium]|nr:hypothetical protein [Myxococcales bacterium]